MNGGLSKSKNKLGHWISEKTPPLLVDLIHFFLNFPSGQCDTQFSVNIFHIK